MEENNPLGRSEHRRREILFVAYGTPSRITRAAIRLLEAEGIKAGLLRPITLWPFPSKALKQAAMQDSVKAVVDVELSMGQMIDDVKIALEGRRPVSFVGKAGGVVPTPADVAAVAKQAIGGGKKKWRLYTRNQGSDRCGAALLPRLHPWHHPQAGCRNSGGNGRPGQHHRRGSCGARSVFAYNYFNCDMHEAAHGRAPAVATGIKRVSPPGTIVFTYQG